MYTSVSVVVDNGHNKQKGTMPKKKAAERASKASRKTPKFQPEATRTAGLITPRQAADILSISTRTLGRWAVAYEKSLSATARRKGRKRFFTGADMNIFQEAALKMDQGLEIKDIATTLTLVDPNAEAQRSAMVLSTEVAMQVGETKQIAQQMVQEIHRLRQENEQQKETNTIQQTIIERLNARLAAVEAHLDKSVIERAVSKYKKPDIEETGFLIIGKEGAVDVELTPEDEALLERLAPEEDKE